MVNVSINKSKMFLPLSSAKGTTEQRLEKARSLNLKFYKNLQDRFVKREVKPGAFKQELQKAAGVNIGVEVVEVLHKDNVPFTHMISNANSKKIKIDKYMFSLPFARLNDRIEKSSAPKFLRTTQKFFNEILNPKFLTRKVTMLNKYDNFSETTKFYSENISGKNHLDAKSLEKFLSNKSAQEQIDTLQHFRYNLLSEENIHNADFQIDKLIEKLDNLRYENKNYDLSVYNYDNKKSILNNKLAELLKQTRENLIK